VTHAIGGTNRLEECGLQEIYEIFDVPQRELQPLWWRVSGAITAHLHQKQLDRRRLLLDRAASEQRMKRLVDPRDSLTKYERVLETLEHLVDETSLGFVLEKMSEICSLKAEHIRNAWQDDGTADRWEETAGDLDILRVRVEKLQL
jgi:hypothetical protein